MFREIGCGNLTSRKRFGTALFAALVSILPVVSNPVAAEVLTPQQQLAFDIYKELVEINTVTATGDTARAAEAMAVRLRAAGFADADVHVFSPAPHKGNLVARLRGTGARKPILLLAHLDVVPANREDWSLDPFKLIEKDGYFYARGSGDDKYMAASFVANLIRYRQEGYKPDRDIILALETDEEILDKDALGIQWLLKNHRDLIDAEFALNEGGAVGPDLTAVSSRFSRRDILESMKVTAVTRADTIELGKKGRAIDVMQAPIRLIATRWLYDRATRTLFSSDMFTHVWRDTETGPWVVTEADNDPTSARHIRSFLLNTRYWWLEGAPTDSIRRGIGNVFDTYDVETIAPGYGCILRGKKTVAKHMQLVDDVLKSLDKSVAVSRYVGRDEER